MIGGARRVSYSARSNCVREGDLHRASLCHNVSVIELIDTIAILRRRDVHLVHRRTAHHALSVEIPLSVHDVVPVVLEVLLFVMLYRLVVLHQHLPVVKNFLQHIVVA